MNEKHNEYRVKVSKSDTQQILSMTVELTDGKKRYEQVDFLFVCIRIDRRPHNTNTQPSVYVFAQWQQKNRTLCNSDYANLKRSRFHVVSIRRIRLFMPDPHGQMICCVCVCAYENQLTSTFYQILTIHAVCCCFHFYYFSSLFLLSSVFGI